MTSQRKTLKDVLRGQALFIPFTPFHRRVAGDSLTAGIVFAFLLREFVYHNRDKIYYTDQEIMNGTALKAGEMRTVKEALKALPFITLTREGGNGRTHYEMDWDGYAEFCDLLICESRNSQIAPPADLLILQNPLIQNTKTKNTIPSQPAPAGSGTLLTPAQTKRQQVEVNTGRFQRLYLRLWKERHPKQEPKFGAKEGKQIKELFSHFKGDRVAFKLALKRYMANDEHYFRGHEVGLLLQFINRFTVDAPQDLDNGQVEPSMTYLVKEVRVTTAEDIAAALEEE